MQTTFTGLRPDDSYNMSVAVNMRYGLGQAVSVAATTASECFITIVSIVGGSQMIGPGQSICLFVNKVSKNL